MRKKSCFSIVILLGCLLYLVRGKEVYSVEEENTTDQDIIKLQVSFSQPIILHEGGYQIVRLPGSFNQNLTGKPAVPFKSIKVLLPYGKRVVTINVISGESRRLEGNYLIKPGQKSFSPGEAFETTLPDECIYSSSEPYPKIVFNALPVQNLRGYRILCISLYPVRYFPSKREIVYFENLTVKIQTLPSEIAPGFRRLARDSQLVAKYVDNPEMLVSYPVK